MRAVQKLRAFSNRRDEGVAKEEAMEDDSSASPQGVNLANAVDLSESEEEEEMEDIIDDFAVALDAESVRDSI